MTLIVKIPERVDDGLTIAQVKYLTASVYGIAIAVDRFALL